MKEFSSLPVYMKYAMAKGEVEIYANENTNVDLQCSFPLNNSTWSYRNGSFIVIHGKINECPHLQQKYKIEMRNGYGQTLTIQNFSNADKGIYRCQMGMRSETFSLLLCRKFFYRKINVK